MDKLAQKNIEFKVFAPCSYNYDYKGSENYLIKAKCFNKIDRLIFYYKYKKAYNKLLNTLDIEEYSLLHAHSLFANGYIAYRIYKEYKIPYIVAVRNTDVNVFFKYFVYLRSLGINILENAKKIVFISNSYKEKLLKQYIPESKRKIIEEKCIVIPNGIDEYFLNEEKEPKEFNNKELNLVYTGRVDKNKNIITTIKCCNNILKKKYNVRLTIIGDITLKKYKNIIKKHKFINYVGKKNKEEIVDIYKNMDIFVMPSKHETFGLVYAEAMSQGLPVIYTKNEGFDNFFKEGEVGYSIVYNNYNEMEEKIELILKNYKEISKNCIHNAKCFNWDTISDKYIDVYTDLERNN